jgi:hypothetical protein
MAGQRGARNWWELTMEQRRNKKELQKREGFDSEKTNESKKTSEMYQGARLQRKKKRFSNGPGNGGGSMSRPKKVR